MTKKIILFNGPPGVGKDTAGDALLREGIDGFKLKFSDPVKHGTHTSYGIYGVSADHFEALKDTSLPEFMWLTPRQAYIDHSERYMKPLHGPEVFGKVYLNTMRRTEAPIIVTSDSGFYDEAMPVVREVGAENVLLVRLHMRGKDFSNDSRSYIELPGVETVDLWNQPELKALFEDEVFETVSNWLNY